MYRISLIEKQNRYWTEFNTQFVCILYLVYNLFAPDIDLVVPEWVSNVIGYVLTLYSRPALIQFDGIEPCTTNKAYFDSTKGQVVEHVVEN